MPLLRILSLSLLLTACVSDETDGEDVGEEGSEGSEGVPDAYVFTSHFSDESSVAYGGQTARHLLIHDLTAYVLDLTYALDNGRSPEQGDVLADLEFYFSEDNTGVPHRFVTLPDPLQTTYDAVSSGKNLEGKIAGNDAEGQHKDWTRDFVGWARDGVTTPESLVRVWFDRLDQQAVDWSLGHYPLDPSGLPVPSVYITPEGTDLAQLLDTFLRGAVAYSQGTDDYLDDDATGKGLLADHSAPAEGKPYTALEHAWDEGFGYFGAARTFGSWSDVEIAAGVMDVDQDNAIDLTAEVCWGHSIHAAERDLGAIVPVDFTEEAWEGFAGGRQLLATQDAENLDRVALANYRNQAVLGWEKAIAASAVHSINQVLQDMAAAEAGQGYSFAEHAKHWSELKGLALSLQFNPRSRLSDGEFEQLHATLRTSPELQARGAAHDVYILDLLFARTLIGEAFDFDDANLGDENGENGW